MSPVCARMPGARTLLVLAPLRQWPIFSNSSRGVVIFKSIYEDLVKSFVRVSTTA